MRTNIVLDKKLIAKAMKKAGVTTMRETVEIALREYVRETDFDSLLALYGSDLIAPDYDPKRAAGAPHLVAEPQAPYRAAKRRSPRR